MPYPSWRSLADGQAWLRRIAQMHSAGTGQQYVIAERTVAGAPAAVIGS